MEKGARSERDKDAYRRCIEPSNALDFDSLPVAVERRWDLRAHSVVRNQEAGTARPILTGGMVSPGEA
jgi:hypothetical protein